MDINTVTLKGTYTFEIRDVDGNIKDSWTVDNIVTNAGKAQLALLTGDASAVPFTFLAVGTSSTAVAATDTTLTAEIVDSGLERAAGTVSRVTTTVTNDTFQITKTWTASGSKTVEEVGVFNAASAGTMLSHALTTSKAVTSGETITATYQLRFS
jgi:hypothetical protein